MTLLKRLQMLVNVNNTLSSILPSHDYKQGDISVVGCFEGVATVFPAVQVD